MVQTIHLYHQGALLSDCINIFVLSTIRTQFPLYICELWILVRFKWLVVFVCTAYGMLYASAIPKTHSADKTKDNPVPLLCEP